MDYNIFATQDNAEGQLQAGINTVATLITLKAGEGDEFPAVYTSTTDSAGTSTTLNKTGIGATGVAVGDFIENITDGSHAFVLSVAADSLTTTELQGGSDNTWENTDEYAVNRFIVTLNARDGDGVITKSEKVLIGERSGDILTADSRGYDGDIAKSFDADDYVNLFVVSKTIRDIGKAFAEVSERLDAAASLDYVNGALANRNWKQSVRVATTGAQTLASDFENGDNIDGVALVTGDRVLIKDQAAGAENGIYTVNATGAPTRATDFDENAEATSAMVSVEEGTVNADSVYLCTDDEPNIGVDNITFVSFGSSLVIASEAEAEAGANNTKTMTPLRTKQAIDYNKKIHTLVAGEDITVAGDAVPAFICLANGSSADEFVFDSDTNTSRPDFDVYGAREILVRFTNNTGSQLKITSFDVYYSAGGLGDLVLDVYRVAGNLPDGASIATGSTAGGGSPINITLAPEVTIDDGEEVMIVIQSPASTVANFWGIERSSVGNESKTSLDGGTTWSGFGDSASHAVYGYFAAEQGKVYATDMTDTIPNKALFGGMVTESVTEGNAPAYQTDGVVDYTVAAGVTVDAPDPADGTILLGVGSNEALILDNAKNIS